MKSILVCMESENIETIRLMESDFTTHTEPVDSQLLARNYFRLARLTLIAGTDQIRRCVLGKLDGQDLPRALKRNRSKMEDLLRRHVISRKQWSLLYPQDSNVNVERNIDITLWIVLLRNIVPFARLGVRNIRWGVAPKDDEKEWFHDVLRIRETRNSLAHFIRPELDCDKFDHLWRYVSKALKRLDRDG